MKKIIISAFALVLGFVFSATVAQAQAVFNNPGALPTLTITNASTNPCNSGPVNGCWTTSTSANPGEVIAVQVYYYNTSNTTAQATTLSIQPKNSSQVSSLTFNGGVASTSGPRSTGSATVTMSTPATITYMTGTARWYVNGGATYANIDENGLFGSTGYNIGNIAPGQSGTLVANFRVGPGQTTPYECNDGIDNDGDGRIDYPNDQGCSASNDNSEYNYVAPQTYQCNDGVDNDSDGFVDGSDAGCTSSTDNDEYNYVAPQQTCNANLSSNTYSVTSGNSAVLNWTTTGLGSLTIYPNVGTVAQSGSTTVYPTTSTVYTLSGYGCGSTTTRTVTINVNNTINQTYQCNDGYDNDGDGYIDYPNDQGCSYSTDNDESNYVSSQTCDANFYSSASSTYVSSGNPVTLSWTTNGLSSVSIYPNVGTINSSGSTTVYPTVNTVYTLSGYGCSNTYSRSVNIYVNSTNPIIYNNQNLPQAITTVATILSNTQARINGVAVPNTTLNNVTAWFEWGTTGYLGNRTSTQTINSSTSNSNNYYNDVLENLVPGTMYYYRAVVQNQYGISRGDIVRFQTQSGAKTIVPVTKTTSKSQASLLELKVENTYERACVENIVDYTVSYTNTSNQTLKDAVLRFTNPKEITYISSSKGKYDVIDRTLTVDVGDMIAGEKGTLIVHGRINSDAKEGNLLVSTSTIVYTNSITKSQEDAIAYSLITVDKENDCPNTNTNAFGASTSGFWSFLPNTLVEWLLLILVILGLVVLGGNLYTKKA